MSTPTHHRFPKSILSLSHLGGGDFGTLEVIALDRNRVELMLGGDFIQLSRAQWIKVHCAIDALLGTEVAIDLKVTEPDGEVVEARIKENVRPPARRRRRAPARTEVEPQSGEG